MNTTIQLVADYLQAREMAFERQDDRIRFGITGKNSQWLNCIETDEEEEVVTLIAMLPVRVSRERREAFAVFLTKLNVGRRMGNFHFDMDEGGVLYCISVPVAGLAEHRDVILDRLVGTACVTVDSMFPKICAQAFGGVSGAKQERVSSGLSEGSRRWTSN